MRRQSLLVSRRPRPLAQETRKEVPDPINYSRECKQAGGRKFGWWRRVFQLISLREIALPK